MDHDWNKIDLGLFGDLPSENLKDEYTISRKVEDGGWEWDFTTLHIMPFNHRYVLERESGHINYHGSDQNDYHAEEELSPEQAVEMLREAVPDAGELLFSYEESCSRAYKNCVKLIGRHLPGVQPQSTVYSSERTTIISVRNEDGSESAVKICTIAEQDFRNIEHFHSALAAAGGCQYLIGVEKLVNACRVDEGNCIMLMKMPLLEPAFLIKDGAWYHASIANNPWWLNTKWDRDTLEFLRIFTLSDAAFAAAKALEAVHSLRYAHHDVRPENILVDADGNLYLADLCSLKPLAEQYDGHMEGSSSFRAPELTEKRPYGANIDIFSWGCTMLYILLGTLPEQGFVPEDVKTDQYHIKAAINGRQKQGSHYGPDGAKFSVVVAKALSKNPMQRYRDGAELAYILENMGELIEVPEEALPDKKKRKGIDLRNLISRRK